MKLSIVGLGYVGVVCAACFAKEGHEVIGVDIDKVKVDLINNKKAPIVEEGLEELIKEGVESGRLKATTDLKEAVKNSDITIIAVGTPSKPNGDIDLTYIKKAAEQIGEVLKEKDSFHIVAMRSTVLPRTGRDVVIPILEEKSGKKLSKDFGYVSNPEFLRESTAIYDFYNPPKTVIGASDEKSSKTFKELYSFLDAPLFEVEIEVAEMIKYADNSWHATKVTFANEIGMICKKLDIDSHRVMDVFCADTKLNISPYYLKPGFAFGGSCLPKDVRAITYKAKHLDENVPLLNSLMNSNEYQVKRVFNEFIKPLKKRNVGVLGISFKANTDDLRESPILELTEMLIGKGYNVSIYDKSVLEAREKGANKKLLEEQLPHINSRLNANLLDVLEKNDIIIIGNSSDEFKQIDFSKYPDTIFIDLVRILNEKSKNNYIGLAW